MQPVKPIEPIIKRRVEIINQNGSNVRVIRSKVYYPKGYVHPEEQE